MSILVDEKFLETLRCSICNNFLSIPPITIISDDGIEQKCGRCRDISTGIAIRNTFFEKIAAKVKFPCMYSGCQTLLRWGKVKSHEENCIYRTLKCPMFQSCEEMVRVHDLRRHFEEKHAENVCDADDFIDIPIYFDKYTISILTMGCTHCLVARYFTKEIFWFQVFSLFPDDDFEYELKLDFHKSGKFSSSFKSKAVLFEENYHCFRCSLGECQERCHKNSLRYNQNLPRTVLYNKFYIDSAAPTSNLWATLKIIWAEKPLSPVAVSINNSSLIDRILQCPVCEEYMTSPIFICIRGHSICNVCKPKLDKCPTCRSSFKTSIRNFVLEDVADNVGLFCHWKDEGCNFMGNVNEVSQHHQNCEYKNKPINSEDD